MVACVPGAELATPSIAGLDVPRPLALVQQERHFAANELIFQAGDPKVCLYRVESGAVCMYDTPGKDLGSIEFAFPGDAIGLGFLKHHVRSARALSASVLACFPPDAAADLVSGDPIAEAKLSDAIEREFAARRNELCEQGAEAPVERVAALLLSLRSANINEGRRPDRIADFWQCGALADMAGIGLDDLTAILVQFERWGLIETTFPAGLLLKRIDELEAIAADGSSSDCASDRDTRRIRPPSPHEDAKAA